MASNWTMRGIGQGYKPCGGSGRGVGVDRRYIRTDYNVFSRLADPTTQSDTEFEYETSDTEGMVRDANGDGFIMVEGKRAKMKRRHISSGGRNGARGKDAMHVQEHGFDEDPDFENMSMES